MNEEITDQASRDARAIAITRFVVAVVAVINLVAQSFGWSPLEIDYQTIYTIVSGIGAVVAIAWCWWRNNNMTKKAQEMQEKLTAAKNAE